MSRLESKWIGSVRQRARPRTPVEKSSNVCNVSQLQLPQPIRCSGDELHLAQASMSVRFLPALIHRCSGFWIVGGPLSASPLFCINDMCVRSGINDPSIQELCPVSAVSSHCCQFLCRSCVVVDRDSFCIAVIIGQIFLRRFGLFGIRK